MEVDYIRNQILEYYKDERYLKILEIFGDDFRLIKEIEQFKNIEYMGIMSSSELIEKSKEFTNTSSKSCFMFLPNKDDIEVLYQKFDCIIIRNIDLAYSDFSKYIKLCRTLLVPNGIIIAIIFKGKLFNFGENIKYIKKIHGSGFLYLAIEETDDKWFITLEKKKV